ncbi:hypothetical protein L3X38_026360 [Prunus dulcis]|uniref:Uncharacterized protein n=1 Tax=Prunus dulcis TaxID=3755 RepID=A0AAD4YZE1_PRUDU|nr:hypothetical protein L3X38_026360 [Prunus dulcis]
MMINVNEENVWDEYVKDDIVDLCGKDRATGEGAETCLEAIEVIMTHETELNNTVDLEGDTPGFESSLIDDVSPSSSCPKKRNQTPSDITSPKKRGA